MNKIKEEVKLTSQVRTVSGPKLWCFEPSSSSNAPLVRCFCSFEACSTRNVRCPIGIGVQSMGQHSKRCYYTNRLLAPNAHSLRSPTRDHPVAEWSDILVCCCCTSPPALATKIHASNWCYFSHKALEYRPSMHLVRRTIHNLLDQC